MDHDDEIAIVDSNCLALEHSLRVIRADGVDRITMLDVVLQVPPVIDFVPQ